jgi:hypothetical protein
MVLVAFSLVYGNATICKALSGEKGVFIEITQGVGYIPTSPGASTKRSS